jgi:phytoene dehydrogenase-like protein
MGTAGNSIIIIGAGMGGLSAGIYGQRNGFTTQIFEMHRLPGGQCASWKRKGYTFDGCIHHLFGCDPNFHIYRLWEELGAMPRALAPVQECTSVQDAQGRLFQDFYDPAQLRDHLLSLAPQDRQPIDDYLRGLELCARRDMTGTMIFGGMAGMLAVAPLLWQLRKQLKPTLAQFGARFTDPFLRRAFPLLLYSDPKGPLLVHMIRHSAGVAWPESGALRFAQSVAARYTELGGEIHYSRKVVKILTAAGRAVGVKLDDGSEVRADWVISDADGRRTINELLDGRYVDETIRRYCEEPNDETNWAVHVFLGVNRDLAREPSALVLLLDKPVEIAGHACHSIEMQIYGFDPTMAPPGKGVIKVELFSRYSYWQQLAADRARYDEEKARVADLVIDLLEQYHFPGLRSQVEVVDVPTLLTWERYMGGTHGFANMPKKPFNVMKSMTGALDATLPGLQRFYFVGAWATSAGALFMNALSGRTIMRRICKEEGRRFIAPHQL